GDLRRGGGDQTGHVRLKRATSRSLRTGLRFSESARRALCSSSISSTLRISTVDKSLRLSSRSSLSLSFEFTRNSIDVRAMLISLYIESTILWNSAFVIDRKSTRLH